MIKLSPEVMSIIRSPEYTIYSETYSNFEQSYSAAFPQLQLLIPTRYSSLKTAFVIFRPSTAVANATYLLYPSSRATMGLTDYQFLLGSEAYPPTKIKGTDSGFCEPFEELKKSFHCGGGTLDASMGILNATNYQIAAATGADAATTGTFILACDFESYSGKSGALLSGVNTLGSDLYLSATFSASEAATIDTFLHYDMKLIIKDGILSINV